MMTSSGGGTSKVKVFLSVNKLRIFEKNRVKSMVRIAWTMHAWDVDINVLFRKIPEMFISVIFHACMAHAARQRSSTKTG